MCLCCELAVWCVYIKERGVKSNTVTGRVLYKIKLNFTVYGYQLFSFGWESSDCILSVMPLQFSLTVIFVSLSFSYIYSPLRCTYTVLLHLSLSLRPPFTLLHSLTLRNFFVTVLILYNFIT